jgi:hypothetical protein
LSESKGSRSYFHAKPYLDFVHLLERPSGGADGARTGPASDLTPPALLARTHFRMSPSRPDIAKIPRFAIIRFATTLAAEPNGQSLAYILLPEFSVQIRLHDRPRGDVVGETEGTDWEGMRHEVLGNAQAWYYPKDQALVLWECFLEDRHRQADPTGDANLQTVWRGFERVLLARSPDATKLYTTWEDIYERPVWRRFLEQQGYRQVDKAAFLREVANG